MIIYIWQLTNICMYIGNKKELKECKDKLESRVALIMATKMALEHVIDTAKMEVIDS